VSKWLIAVGLILVAAGLLWPVMSNLGLGRLPGDIVVRREGFSLYFPLMTCLDPGSTSPATAIPRPPG